MKVNHDDAVTSRFIGAHVLSQRVVSVLMGGGEQVTALVTRLMGAGLFGLFLEEQNSRGGFRFGRRRTGPRRDPGERTWTDQPVYTRPTAG
jgi:hypothetical protein